MSDRLRVLYLSSWRVGPRGEGDLSFVHEQIVALSSLVDAIFVQHGFRSLRDMASRAEDNQSLRDAWPSSVRTHRLHTLRLPTRLTRRSLLGDIRRAGRNVARQLRRLGERIDLVHAHVVLPAGLLATEVAAELGVPLIIQEHSGPFEMHLDTEEKAAAARESLSRAAVVMAVSHSLARKLREAVPTLKCLEIVPNLVRTEIFTPRPMVESGQPLRLIAVGGLVPVKDHALLLRTVAELSRRRNDATLTLVGDGPLYAELESLARKLGIAERVSFAGHLSRSDTAQAMASSHVYVCSSRVETFGLAVAEAIACGRPVVSTACGGPEEIIQDGMGLIVHASDAASMADAIQNVQARLHTFDPATMHESIEQRFGVESFRQRMLAVYNSTQVSFPSARSTVAG